MTTNYKQVIKPKKALWRKDCRFEKEKKLRPNCHQLPHWDLTVHICTQRTHHGCLLFELPGYLGNSNHSLNNKINWRLTSLAIWGEVATNSLGSSSLGACTHIKLGSWLHPQERIKRCVNEARILKREQWDVLVRKSFVAKPEVLSSNPRTHKLETEKCLASSWMSFFLHSRNGHTLTHK